MNSSAILLVTLMIVINQLVAEDLQAEGKSVPFESGDEGEDVEKDFDTIISPEKASSSSSSQVSNDDGFGSVEKNSTRLFPVKSM